MNNKQKIDLALKHLEQPYYFVEGLTEREREAVRLASRGLSIPAVIAPQMKVTPKTVYAYLNSASYKISVWLNKDVEFADLTELLLKIVEGILKND